MILNRKIYNKLISWKNLSKGKTALLIEGARRIGKSTICREFGKNEYKSYILIDFSNASKDILDIFNDISDLNVFFQKLQLFTNIELFIRNSLIIFDEVQKFPKARESIKHLVADGRYDYIETGSLISIKENVQNILIPSEEESIKMYPLDFEEFLWARNEKLIIDYIKDCLSKGKKLADNLHHKAMWLFNEYMIVGGMPQSIIAYLEGNNDFELADKQKRQILNLYSNDIVKSSKKYSFKVSELFDNIPTFLSSHSKKVVLKQIGNGLTFNMFRESFFWLQSSMIANICYKCNDPNVGLSLNKNTSYVKCFMGDTGLLVTKILKDNLYTSNALYNSIMHSKLSLNKGMIYENMIAQMITAQGFDLYCYEGLDKEINKSIEIDFLLSAPNNGKYLIKPIEVKSSKNYTNDSYTLFKKKFKGKISDGLIIHPKHLEYKDKILRLPPYMFPFYLQNIYKKK